MYFTDYLLDYETVVESLRRMFSFGIPPFVEKLALPTQEFPLSIQDTKVYQKHSLWTYLG